MFIKKIYYSSFCKAFPILFLIAFDFLGPFFILGTKVSALPLMWNKFKPAIKSYPTKWEQIADLTKKGHVQPKPRWYLLVLLNVREYFDPLAPLYSTLFFGYYKIIITL